MLQIFKAIVNGKKGYVCILAKEDERHPRQFAFESKQDIAQLLDML